jgi:hypothetical protein
MLVRWSVSCYFSTTHLGRIAILQTNLQQKARNTRAFCCNGSLLLRITFRSQPGGGGRLTGIHRHGAAAMDHPMTRCRPHEEADRR